MKEAIEVLEMSLDADVNCLSEWPEDYHPKQRLKLENRIAELKLAIKKLSNG